MARWLILLVVGYLVYRFLKGLLTSPKIPRRDPPKEIQDEMVQDPICKVYLPKRQAMMLNGPGPIIHYFCSSQCRDTFIGQAKKKASSQGAT
jgi:YHS domain-containing protein